MDDLASLLNDLDVLTSQLNDSGSSQSTSTVPLSLSYQTTQSFSDNSRNSNALGSASVTHSTSTDDLPPPPPPPQPIASHPCGPGGDFSQSWFPPPSVQNHGDDALSSLLDDISSMPPPPPSNTEPDLPPPPADLPPPPVDALPPPPPIASNTDLSALLNDLQDPSPAPAAPETDDDFMAMLNDLNNFSSQSFESSENDTVRFDTIQRKKMVTENNTKEEEEEDDGDSDFDLSLDNLEKEIEMDKIDKSDEVDLSTLTPEERLERQKALQMKIALEKMKEARVQKLVVKVYNKDDSSKTLFINEKMSVRTVIKQLLEKNHFDYNPNWALVEEMPGLYIERMFESSDKPCEIISNWPRDSANQLRLLERKDKYALFKNPQIYLLHESDSKSAMEERHKDSLIDEFFSETSTSAGVPEVQGFLYVKSDGKSWSKKYCVLRSSGLYVNKSGDAKRGKRSANLSCLATFGQQLLYFGRGWKKKHKSPYDYGFALKHPQIQAKSKHIKYFCCEDFRSFMRWTIGIRIAKYGRQLLDDYEQSQEDAKSASVIQSHIMLQNKVVAASNSPAKSANKGSPRAVGFKNAFEGAWQRGNSFSKPNNPQAVTTTAASLQSSTKESSNASPYTSPAKQQHVSTGNWWDLAPNQQAPSPSHQPRAYQESSTRL